MDEKQFDAISKLPGLRAAIETLHEALEKAIEAAREYEGIAIPVALPEEYRVAVKRKKIMSPEGRKSVSDAQRKRWAELRKKKKEKSNEAGAAGN